MVDGTSRGRGRRDARCIHLSLLRAGGTALGFSAGRRHGTMQAWRPVVGGASLLLAEVGDLPLQLLVELDQLVVSLRQRSHTIRQRRDRSLTAGGDSDGWFGGGWYGAGGGGGGGGDGGGSDRGGWDGSGDGSDGDWRGKDGRYRWDAGHPSGRDGRDGGDGGRWLGGRRRFGLDGHGGGCRDRASRQGLGGGSLHCGNGCRCKAPAEGLACSLHRSGRPRRGGDNTGSGGRRSGGRRKALAPLPRSLFGPHAAEGRRWWGRALGLVGVERRGLPK
mmetsp:Transcript_23469/g.69739  ORF Transcript_23469/g.69739 Transcript_23469/m.69739 type:complete len:276 (-) Transcript_23469:495-1322(-)